MNGFMPRILLYRGKGLIGQFIRWQTRGDYAHAAVQVCPNSMIEAKEGQGVRRTVVGIGEHDAFEVPCMTADQWLGALAFLHEQLGKPYDYLGVLRFISRSPAGGRQSWFCSELVFAAALAAGVRLLERVEPWAVSPHMLSVSPLLRPLSARRGLAMASRQCSDPRIEAFLNSNVIQRHG